MLRELYLNKKQIKLLHALISGEQKIHVFIGGRGSGKSTILGEYLARCVDTMPRSRGMICGPTLTAIENRSLPSIQEHWERMGYIEGEDYVIGKQPPRDWDRSYNKIKSYKNSIAWWNGATIDLVSLYAEGGARGGNYQFVAGDEMAMVKRENFGPSVLPAMRGLLYKTARIELEPTDSLDVPFGQVVEAGLSYIWEIPFALNPFYNSMLLVSSMPYLDRGMWLLDYENNPEAFYIESTALDNIEVLGPDYVPNLQAAMHEIEFRIEVMNERMTKNPDTFYPRFNEDRHIIDTNPYNPDLPLEISFDFGKFTCITVGQTIGEKACVVDALYVKNGSVEDLMIKFNARYEQHLCKEVSIYGDVQGNNKRDDYEDRKALFEEVEDALRLSGWRYSRDYRVFNPGHAEKYLVINKALGEKETELPPVRIFRGNCAALIMSIKFAGMKENYKKDKSSEHPNSPTPAEHATHLCDAFDYWYFPRFNHLYNAGSAGAFAMGIG